MKRKRTLSVFVRNRLREILQDNSITFRYINTKENPADIPTRGQSAEDLKQNKMWWNGPEWLKENAEKWPTWQTTKVDQETLDKINSETIGQVLYEISNVASENNTSGTPFGIDCNRFSSLIKLLRVTAYVKRFIDKVKKIKSAGDLTAKETEDAERTWIMYLQQKHYMT